MVHLPLVCLSRRQGVPCGPSDLVGSTTRRGRAVAVRNICPCDGDSGHTTDVSSTTQQLILTLSGYLTFNLFILLMDAREASISIDQLIILAESKCLTFTTFTKVRDDIHRRVDISRWASDIIVVPCVASVIAVQVLFADNKLSSYYAFALILFKELLFVAVAFWYVAQVNEKADRLTLMLSRTMWDAAASVGENERLSIVASSMQEPISFTLVFRRLGLINVVLSFVGCGATLLVGITKQALL